MSTTILKEPVPSSGTETQRPTGKWGYDLSHSKLGFTISHFGISETEGRFTKFDGYVYSDRPDFSDAAIDLIIDVASVMTNTFKSKNLESQVSVLRIHQRLTARFTHNLF